MHAGTNVWKVCLISPPTYNTDNYPSRHLAPDECIRTKLLTPLPALLHPLGALLIATQQYVGSFNTRILCVIDHVLRQFLRMLFTGVACFDERIFDGVRVLK